jgi:hypothetical protein
VFSVGGIDTAARNDMDAGQETHARWTTSDENFRFAGLGRSDEDQTSRIRRFDRPTSFYCCFGVQFSGNER